MLIAILAFLGFADATFLSLEYYLNFNVPCGLTGGCDTVLQSKYATVGPLPTALFGVIYYLAILILAVGYLTSENKSIRTLISIFYITTLGLLASIGLVYLQLFVIRAICVYCMISATITLLLFLTSAFLINRIRKPEFRL
ncbi:vitamin K epoxide reductase family protein [Candidatus Giovannonibacteria bacterium]|nr:vitamin K epoxide reductase family protein [Candidatus Giovannonibacteria bacterium]